MHQFRCCRMPTVLSLVLGTGVGCDQGLGPEEAIQKISRLNDKCL